MFLFIALGLESAGQKWKCRSIAGTELLACRLTTPTVIPHSLLLLVFRLYVHALQAYMCDAVLSRDHKLSL